jgi:hypothetical protein
LPEEQSVAVVSTGQTKVASAAGLQIKLVSLHVCNGGFFYSFFLKPK